MRHSYHTEQWLPYPVAKVFAFFANPSNLPALMPPWQKVRLDWSFSRITPPRPLPADRLRYGTKAAGEHSKFALSFLPFPYSPIRLRWHAEITAFAWNDHFCDRQLRGPFTYWSHCHRLHPAAHSGAAGTIVADEVDYELPLGAFGELAHRLFVRRQIECAFAFRQSRLAELLPNFTPVPAKARAATSQSESD
jgi:ligand-binding SRPBCC domain-containing protein